MSGNHFAEAVENEDRRLLDNHVNHTHANETHSPRPIPISWLEGKKNWPDHAERKLEDFMVANSFLNYKSTKDDSCQKLDRILCELQSLFDVAAWDNQIHPEKLKEKVCNKIHRIRAKRNILAKLRKILRKLPIEACDEAVHAMVEAFGKEKVTAGLADLDLDVLDWMDLNTFGEA